MQNLSKHAQVAKLVKRYRLNCVKFVVNIGEEIDKQDEGQGDLIMRMATCCIMCRMSEARRSGKIVHNRSTSTSAKRYVS